MFYVSISGHRFIGFVKKELKLGSMSGQKQELSIQNHRRKTAPVSFNNS